MPKICIKCKKGKDSGVEIQKYEYARTKTRGTFRSYKSSTTVSISFPVCPTCASEFKKYQSYETIFDITGKYLIIISIFLWATKIIEIILYLLNISYSLFRTNYYNIYNWITWILAIIIPIIYFIMYKIVKGHPNRISQYIDMNLNGEVTIKDTELKEEIIKKKEKEILDFQKNINVIFCPNCGEKYPSGTDFCLSCGKDMRQL